jgi:hypothetical protein
MACPRCGSWSVRADRSLGGRMVCGRCGTPLGGVSRGRARRSLPLLPRRGRWRLWLLVLVIGAAALAFADANHQPLNRSPGVVERGLQRWQ